MFGTTGIVLFLCDDRRTFDIKSFTGLRLDPFPTHKRMLAKKGGIVQLDDSQNGNSLLRGSEEGVHPTLKGRLLGCSAST